MHARHAHTCNHVHERNFGILSRLESQRELDMNDGTSAMCKRDNFDKRLAMKQVLLMVVMVVMVMGGGGGSSGAPM